MGGFQDYLPQSFQLFLTLQSQRHFEELLAMAENSGAR